MPGEHVRLDLESFNAWREERGFTIQELADAVGKDRTLISRIASGERKATPALINEFARALKVKKVLLLADPNDLPRLDQGVAA